MAPPSRSMPDAPILCPVNYARIYSIRCYGNPKLNTVLVFENDCEVHRRAPQVERLFDPFPSWTRTSGERRNIAARTQPRSAERLFYRFRIAIVELDSTHSCQRIRKPRTALPVDCRHLPSPSDSFQIRPLSDSLA